MIPCAASISACARDCATSSIHSRRSNGSEVFIARKTGSWGSAKRLKASAEASGRVRLLGGQAPVVEPGHLPGQQEAEQVQRDAPAEVGVARPRIEAALGALA